MGVCTNPKIALSPLAAESKFKTKQNQQPEILEEMGQGTHTQTNKRTENAAASRLIAIKNKKKIIINKNKSKKSILNKEDWYNMRNIITLMAASNKIFTPRKVRSGSYIYTF